MIYDHTKNTAEHSEQRIQKRFLHLRVVLRQPIRHTKAWMLANRVQLLLLGAVTAFVVAAPNAWTLSLVAPVAWSLVLSFVAVVRADHLRVHLHASQASSPTTTVGSAFGCRYSAWR